MRGDVGFWVKNGAGRVSLKGLRKIGKKKTFKNVRKRSKTFKNIQKYSKSGGKRSKIFKKIQKFARVLSKNLSPFYFNILLS